MLSPIWDYRPLLDTSDGEAREQLARASVMALSYVAQSARGIGQPAVPQARIDECHTIIERFMTRWRGDPDPAHVEGHRRLLRLGRRARHERLHLHRPGDRLDRRRRRRGAVGAIGAMSGPLHGGAPARVLPMIEEVERTGNADKVVRDILDRNDRLMGFGHRVYRAEDPRARVLRRDRQGARRAAVRGRQRPRAGRADPAARAPSRPRDRDQRRVLGRGHPRLRRGAAAHDAGDVHLCPHRRLVRAHPRAEAHRSPGAPVRPLRRSGAAQPPRVEGWDRVLTSA